MTDENPQDPRNAQDPQDPSSPGDPREGDGLAAARAFAAALFDEGTAVPLADGASPAGAGEVDGRDVCLAVAAGPGDAAGADAESRVRALAAGTGRPLVTVVDAGEVTDPRAFGDLARTGVALSGVVPQVSVVLGAADGARALLLPLADVVVAVPSARSALAEPAAARVVTGLDREAGALGGAELHARTTGRFAHVADDAAGAAEFVRDLLAHLPSNNRASAPRLPEPAPDPAEEDPDLADALPARAGAPYDVREVLARLADDGGDGPGPLELHAAHAPQLVTALVHLDGWSTGVVAPQPAVRGGVLDADAAAKAARFVRLCDAFGLPVLTLVDTAGALPAGEDDDGAPTAALAQLLYAYAEATVPLLTVVTGRAHGPARLVLGSRHVGADLVLAWPRALTAARDEVATATATATASATAAAPGTAEDWARAVHEAARAAGPEAAVRDREVDAVVDPARTRARLAAALRLLHRKSGHQPARRHGNVPL
ncbi:carboxyl transferase domain-containing protein [Kineococcus sp. SYSU DK006]|uniref:carboxyl transferase domain-containing protein n=1 Tax=Kineococcus sp. SYSU DK006 TaxID=3383127 RepID=UPI003D7DC9B9